MNTIHRKKMKGEIVSHKGEKTALVQVERYFKHPLYKKYIKRSKKYKAHDAKNEYKEGDMVVIEASRPLSKEKHWKVISLYEYKKENAPEKRSVTETEEQEHNA